MEWVLDVLRLFAHGGFADRFPPIVRTRDILHRKSKQIWWTRGLERPTTAEHDPHLRHINMQRKVVLALSFGAGDSLHPVPALLDPCSPLPLKGKARQG